MSNIQLAKDNNIPLRTAYRVKDRLGLSFEDTIKLMKQIKKPLCKHIDGLGVREYCEKFGYKHQKEFFRHWHILNDKETA